MADYAGAVAAMRARFENAWTETPVAYQNEGFAKQNGPWVYFEVEAMQTDLRGAGLPGDNIWLTTGRIFVHVFTPGGYGMPETLRFAGLACEVFRAATFYRDGQGSKVVCLAPNIDGGDSDADDGKWFRVTVSVPFEFYYNK